MPWNHPIDAHFVAHSARGWPRLVLQVHQLDEYGRSHVHGYGFVHLPLATGAHKLACKLWRPTGSERDEVTAFFLGNTPQLTNDELVYNAWSERWALVTVPSGCVHIELCVITRHFADHQFEQR